MNLRLFKQGADSDFIRDNCFGIRLWLKRASGYIRAKVWDIYLEFFWNGFKPGYRVFQTSGRLALIQD